jgi:hypothetical protein
MPNGIEPPSWREILFSMAEQAAKEWKARNYSRAGEILQVFSKIVKFRHECLGDMDEPDQDASDATDVFYQALGMPKPTKPTEKL